MESIKYANFQKTHSIQNDIEVKESKHLSTKCVKGQLSTNSEKLHLLHNPSDINHIHGLRKYLYTVTTLVFCHNNVKLIFFTVVCL